MRPPYSLVASAATATCYNFVVLHLFRINQPYGRSPMPFGSSMLMLGLLCVIFGLAIIAAPELLAYFVASFLIVVGVSFLGVWWRMRR